MVDKEKREEDYERFIPVLLKLIGDRSYAEVERASGIASGTISKIIKQERYPSSVIIEKLATLKANPQNGITYDIMMAAAGYAIANDYSIITPAGVATVEMTTKKEGHQARIVSAYAEKLCRMEIDRFAKAVSSKLFEKADGELGKNKAEALAYREAAYRGIGNLPKGDEEIDEVVNKIMEEMLSGN